MTSSDSAAAAECLWCDRDCPRCHFPITAGWEHVAQPQPAASIVAICHLRRVVRPLAEALVGYLHHKHVRAPS